MATLLVFLTSCRHKDLCYPEANELQLVADWSEAPNAEVKGLTAYFYPTEQKREPIRWDFQSYKGGKVRLDPGEYQVVCFNNNSEVLRHRAEERYETIESFTSKTHRLFGSLSGQTIPEGEGVGVTQLPPEPFYAGRVSSFRVQATSSEPQQVVVKMERRYIDVVIELLQLTNLDKVLGMSASLSGVAGSYLIGLDQLGQSPVSIPINMEWNKAPSGNHNAWGRSTAYGVLSDERQVLTIFVVMQDGKGYLYHYDVTSQVKRQEGSVVIKINVDELIELPDAKPQGSGMTIEVEEWVDVLVDVKM